MITKEEVQHIADLARLKLSDQEIEKFQKDFSSILEYFEVLSQADVSLVEPMTHALAVENVMRQDQARPGDPEVRVKLLEASPEHDKGYVKVPEIFQ